MSWFKEAMELFRVDKMAFFIVAICIIVAIKAATDGIARVLAAMRRSTGMTPDDVAAIVTKTLSVMEKKYQTKGATEK